MDAALRGELRGRYVPHVNMARHRATVPTKKSSAALSESIAAYLANNGYKRIDGEQNLWQKGSFFANPMFLSYRVQPQELTLEAWVQFMLWPGWYLGEFDLDGMFLVVQKRVLKKHVEAIEKLAN